MALQHQNRREKSAWLVDHHGSVIQIDQSLIFTFDGFHSIPN